MNFSFTQLAYPMHGKVTIHVLLGSKSHRTLSLKKRGLVRATRVVSKFGGLNRSEYLQSRNEVRIEVAVRNIVRSRLRRPRRKADVLKEEMRKCTSKGTGIGGQTSKERFTEITLGRA